LTNEGLGFFGLRFQVFIVSKMVKTLQFIAATLVSINFNREGR